MKTKIEEREAAVTLFVLYCFWVTVKEVNRSLLSFKFSVPREGFVPSAFIPKNPLHVANYLVFGPDLERERV